MKIKYIAFLLMLLAATGCKKINDTEVSDFEVKTSSRTYKAGEKVVFTFEGRPFQVSFYSGETGSDYQYKDVPKTGSTTIDKPFPIKGYADEILREYTYIYTVPGTYRATFVATSKTKFSDEESVKYIDLVIN